MPVTLAYMLTKMHLIFHIETQKNYKQPLMKPTMWWQGQRGERVIMMQFLFHMRALPPSSLALLLLKTLSMRLFDMWMCFCHHPQHNNKSIGCSLCILCTFVQVSTCVIKKFYSFSYGPLCVCMFSIDLFYVASYTEEYFFKLKKKVWRCTEFKE